jgi:uncharacterized membrane protein YkoI
MQTLTITTLLFGFLLAAPITRADAESIALDHVGSGEVVGSERERERGREVYEVEVRADDGRVHEITIAVDDGSVLDEEIED